MKKYSIFALALAMGAMTLTSCEDAFGNFLDKQPSNELTKAEVLGSFTLLEQNHNDTYNFLLNGANRINNSWLDAATDLAESSIGTSGTRTSFNIGNYYGSGGAAELTSVWESRYRGIRKCNITINTLEAENADKLRPADLSVELFQTRKTNFIAEARFLRAYFYWELFLRYGPVPMVTTELDPNGDLMTGYTERPDLKTFMDFLFKEVKECEAGLKTYAETSDETYAGEVNQPTARALYVRMMLYMASPRFSAQSGITWQQAADAAKGFLADYGDNYRLETRTNGGVAAYNNAWLLNSYADKNPEVIFFRNGVAIGWSGISTDTPVGEGGQGGLCPSQNLVDMYDMEDGSAPFTQYDATGAPVYVNGKPSVNAESGYTDQNMWKNRDPRLAASVLYQGSEWNGRAINVIYGQSDNPIGNQNVTPTGYYVRKYIPETILSSNHSGTAKRLWRIFTYSEILLSYAEALNEADYAGNKALVCNLLDQIRHRGGIIGNVANRADLNSQTAMRNFIHKERTIELAFEEHRWWDVRRWNVAGEALGRDIYGIDVAADGTITRKVAQQRKWQDKFYLYPIPEAEVWKIGQDFQNEGWKE
uniref:RagB/SusD family nutrient uptake outer membrane protein n=1 Tax=Segatella copri TaxID=165179 RepID=UPI0026226B7D|nr:RagB/SusD family nutrient uptake outer membrane protein [uncultured Prevotella sp.]